MEYIYTIREDGEIVYLTVTSKPTGKPLEVKKLLNKWAIKTYKKEGYEGKLLKPNTHVAKHDKVSSTTWKFLKKAKEKTEPELKPTRRSSRRTRTKKNTITKSEE